MDNNYMVIYNNCMVLWVPIMSFENPQLVFYEGGRDVLSVERHVMEFTPVPLAFNTLTEIVLLLKAIRTVALVAKVPAPTLLDEQVAHNRWEE
jgi:hypothetical protein